MSTLHPEPQRIPLPLAPIEPVRGDNPDKPPC